MINITKISQIFTIFIRKSEKSEKSEKKLHFLQKIMYIIDVGQINIPALHGEKMTTKEIAAIIDEANKWHAKARETRNETYSRIADKYRWELKEDAPAFVKDIERKCLYIRLSSKQVWALACNVKLAKILGGAK